MLENPMPGSSATTNIPTVKRYAPPNQRNRSLSRRKSGGESLECASSYVKDGEKNQIDSSRNIPITGGSNNMNGNSRSRLILIHGCSNSEAVQLMNNRWTAAMDEHKKLPENSDERPIIYQGTGDSSWGPVMLPHLVMKPKPGIKDFASELKQAMSNANANANASS